MVPSEMVAKDLKNLFEALGTRRWDDAAKAARAVARAEDKRGRHALARDLVRALEATEDMRPAIAVAAASFLSPLPVDVGLSDVRLPATARATLSAIVAEHHRSGDLRRYHLEPRRRLLLHGPPGCGKSMTARALARELGLPAFLVRYDALIGAWLGQTAQRVQDVFRFAREVPAVVVIDEIDALTRSRGRTNDVGEMDRILIAFLQSLEHEPLAGLLVATTNVAGQLDAALWRRFDVVLEMPRPTAKALQEFARSKAQATSLYLNGTLKGPARKWRSYADATRTLENLARQRVMAGE